MRQGHVALWTRFSKVKVLVVGDLVADHYVYGQTERVSREAPVLVVRHQHEEVKLGGAANAAANVRALGGQVMCVGGLGDDAMGAKLQRLCRAQRIKLSTVKVADTETKTRILAGGVSTTRQQMIRLDRGTTGPLPVRVQKALARHVARASAHCDVILVADYGAGVLSAPVRSALEEAESSGVPVCIDSRYALAAYRNFTLCKPNEPELSALTGLPVGTEEAVEAAARRALELLRCKVLVVTRGNRGMALATVQGVRFIAPHGMKEAVDVTGAGDTVSATLALGLGTQATALEAAVLANVAGALVVQKPGTATVSAAELAKELR